jgi:hypothetical protein
MTPKRIDSTKPTFIFLHLPLGPFAEPDLPEGWIFAGDLLAESRIESAWLAGRRAVSGLL